MLPSHASHVEAPVPHGSSPRVSSTDWRNSPTSSWDMAVKEHDCNHNRARAAPVACSRCDGSHDRLWTRDSTGCGGPSRESESRQADACRRRTGWPDSAPRWPARRAGPRTGRPQTSPPPSLHVNTKLWRPPSSPGASSRPKPWRRITQWE